MLPAYGVMVTDQKSPMYRLAKRAYFIVDRNGIVRFVRVQANPLDLLKTEEVLEGAQGVRDVNGAMSSGPGAWDSSTLPFRTSLLTQRRWRIGW